MPKAARVVGDEPDKGLVTWFNRVARENLWRMPSDIGIKDLVQEGRVCWIVARRKHPEYDTPQTVGYTKRSFYNRLNTYSLKRSHMHQIPISQLVTDEGKEIRIYEAGLEPVSEMGTIATLFAQAPSDIKALLNLFITDAGIKKQRRYARRLPSGEMENEEQRLARLAGIEHRPGLLASLRAYLEGEAA